MEAPIYLVVILLVSIIGVLFFSIKYYRAQRKDLADSESFIFGKSDALKNRIADAKKMYPKSHIFHDDLKYIEGRLLDLELEFERNPIGFALWMQALTRLESYLNSVIDFKNYTEYMAPRDITAGLKKNVLMIDSITSNFDEEILKNPIGNQVQVLEKAAWIIRKYYSEEGIKGDFINELFEHSSSVVAKLLHYNFLSEDPC